MDYSQIISLVFSTFSMIFSIFTHIKYSKCCNCMEIEMKDDSKISEKEDTRKETSYEEEITFQEIKFVDDI